MRRILFTLPVLAALAAAVANSPVASAKNPKVLICHIPPGNTDKAHEILVDTHAVPAHFGHGDNLGTCGLQPM
jgi:hypothetical protein